MNSDNIPYIHRLTKSLSKINIIKLFLKREMRNIGQIHYDHISVQIPFIAGGSVKSETAPWAS